MVQLWVLDDQKTVWRELKSDENRDEMDRVIDYESNEGYCVVEVSTPRHDTTSAVNQCLEDREDRDHQCFREAPLTPVPP